MKVLFTTGPIASRLLTWSATVGAALLAVVLAAAPALAAGPIGGTGPGGSLGGGGGTGCSGVDCYANIWRYIKLSGNAAAPGGGNGSPVPMPPPPCYMEPMFSGPELYALWKAGSPGFPFQGYLGNIKKYKASNAGYWWERVTNLQVAGTCHLPLLAWVRPGAQPPLPQVPAIDLAIYAYDHMRLPSPGLTLNPSHHRGYVSLPSYVWDDLAFYLGTVTATLGDESATVNATAGNLRLGVGQAGRATVYDSGCTDRGSSARPVGTAPPDSGPGTTPDCGVTFTVPSSNDPVTGSIRWTVTSTDGGFPAITTTGANPVTVFEIQSLNGN
jgi:hypothetical protein